MLKKISQLLLLLLLTSGISVFAKESKPTVSATTQKIYTEDDLNIIVTADNPTFSIKLKSNPTTGYRWFLREYNDNIILPLKHGFEKNTENKLIGAPGDELWTFRVKASAFTVPHQTPLRFIYARPWQSNDSSTQLVFRISTQPK